MSIVNSSSLLSCGVCKAVDDTAFITTWIDYFHGFILSLSISNLLEINPSISFSGRSFSGDIFEVYSNNGR